MEKIPPMDKNYVGKINDPEVETNISRRNFLKKISIGALGAAVSSLPFRGIAENDFPNRLDKLEGEEQFIDNQIDTIKEIIINKEYNKILSNTYLVYCLYYSQEFFDKFKNVNNPKYASEKIIKSVAHFITPEFRENSILYFEKQTKLKEHLENKKISTKEVAPLEKYAFGSGVSHNDAIDLYTKELSPIYSMGSGLVIVSENSWDSKNELSTSSVRGGNTVIIFNYLTKEFIRYAHLNEVSARLGELITEGENIGTVGHTGESASLLGHGGHLHLEINKFLIDKKYNQSISADNLKKRLEKI